MSEYMQSRRQAITDIHSLDNNGTLFADTVEELEKATDALVDQGVTNYHEARTSTGLADITQIGWDLPDPESVSVSMLDHYIDELHLLDTMSQMHKRGKLVASGGKVGDVNERYGDHTELVIQGAARNIKIGDQIIKSIYRYNDLKRVGFDPQDLDDDIVQMKYAHRTKYAGSEHRLARAKRRKELKKRIEQLTSEQVVA